MEVHHPHHPTHKKKWSEYIIEFIMLFTAVTLGFFAENIREGIAEKQKKQELLEAVVRDFESDISEIQRHRQMIKHRYENCNDFIKILDLDYNQINKINFYRIAIWHAENKDLILNEKARNEAEAKGYFTNDDINELSTIVNKFNYYFNDYKEVNLGCLESCKRYLTNIIPNFLEPKLFLKTNFIWTNNAITNDKDFQGTLNKPVSNKIKDQILFDIGSRKSLLLMELKDLDSLESFANKGISIIKKN